VLVGEVAADARLFADRLEVSAAETQLHQLASEFGSLLPRLGLAPRPAISAPGTNSRYSYGATEYATFRWSPRQLSLWPLQLSNRAVQRAADRFH
jgi:hypothetical protein